jgi:long-subunit fatty acid transport protein
MRSTWTNPNEFTGRFICVECSLSSWSVNPTVAFRLADRFSIGGGLDVRFSKFELSRRLIADPNPFPVPTTSPSSRSRATPRPRSASTPASSRCRPRTSRSGSRTATRSRSTTRRRPTFVQILTGNTVLDQAVAIALPGSQPATVSYTYPGSFAVGAALRRGYWTLEADFQWMLWSKLDQVGIVYRTRQPSAPRCRSTGRTPGAARSASST